MSGSSNQLPLGHTCGFYIELPNYESKEQLKEKLSIAIFDGHVGYGFG